MSIGLLYDSEEWSTWALWRRIRETGIPCELVRMEELSWEQFSGCEPVVSGRLPAHSFGGMDGRWSGSALPAGAWTVAGVGALCLRGGMEMEPAGLHIADRCIGCGKCAQVCTFGAIQPGEKYSIRGNRCDECGNCYTACPVQAIEAKGA